MHSTTVFTTKVIDFARRQRPAPTTASTSVRTIPAGSVAAIKTAANGTVFDAASLALGQDRDSRVMTADSTLLERISDTDYEQLATHIRTYNA